MTTHPSPLTHNQMPREARIYVAGHRGLVGSAIVRKLQSEGFTNLILRSSSELDLRNQAAVAQFFEGEQPEYVFLAAARVGGIVANNSYPADFINDNLMIQTNVIHHAYLHRVKKLLFLGSTCIYPKLAPQPINEDSLLTGPLEPTNEAYAIAKIAGLIMCKSYNRQYGTHFLSAMPTNLYGPNDNYNLETSHVLPALIRKFHEAKTACAPSVTVWGTGTPTREFVHVDDVAEACLFLMGLPDEQSQPLLKGIESPSFVNIGTGEEVTIRELALLIKEIVNFQGELVFDTGKPDGTPRKLSDASRLHQLGWRHNITLREGVVAAYQSYCDSCN